MKKFLMFLAGLMAILVLSLVAVGFENHVRWNERTDSCIYYYADGDTSLDCIVPTEECEGKYNNIFKDVDVALCNFVPGKPMGDCEEFIEGTLIVLEYNGNDPDGDALVYTFGEPFDEDAEWQTVRGDAGDYIVTVTADDGEFSASDTVCFRILAGNNAPELSIESVAAVEGDTIRLEPVCSDEDGDALTLTFGGDMETAVWETGYDDAGTYMVTVACTDPDGEFDAETVTVTIEDLNRKPVLTGVKDVTVTETEVIRLQPACEDLEGDAVALEFSGDMLSGVWATGYEDSGVYSVTVTCTDDSGLESSETITVNINDRNRPPTITAMVVAG